MIDAKFLKRVSIKFLKIVGWTLASVVVLLFAVILIIRLPRIQNLLTQKAISFLEGKIKTNVDLKAIYISFPTQVVLEELYVEDQQRDTLLFAGSLTIDTDLWQLTQNKVELNTISLSECRANIKRSTNDTTFNFNYIIDAFASPDTVVVTDTTASSWQFSIETVKLSDVGFHYDDKRSGNDVVVDLGTLNIDIDKFDTERSVYSVNDFSLDNTFASITQHQNDSVLNQAIKTTASDSTTRILPIDLDVSDVALNNITLRYHHINEQQRVSIDIGELILDMNKLDLNNSQIDVDELEVNKSFIALQSNQKKVVTPTKNDTVPSFQFDFPWHINVGKLLLAENSFQYYNFAIPDTATTIDFDHLWIMDLQTDVRDVELKTNTISLDLNELSFHEKKGFSLQSFSTNIALTNTQFDLKSFLLMTGASRIEMKGNARYHSLESLPQEYNKAKIDLVVDKSVIAIEDVLYFYPTLLDSLPINLPQQTKVTLDTRVKGFLSNLSLSPLTLKTLDSTSLQMTARIKGLPDINHSVMDVIITKLYTTNNDVAKVIPDSLLTNVQIPRWIALKGSASGLLKAPTIKALLTSSSGAITSEGKVDFVSIPKYDIILKTTDLHLGEILRQDSTVGNLTLAATVKGTGLTMDELDALFDITIEKFRYAGYDYKNFKVNGSLRKYLFSGEAALNDANLDFTLKGDLDYQKDVPFYKATLDVKNVDFKALLLSERPLRARGVLDVSLATADFKVLNGNVNLRNVAVYNGQALYRVDSLLFASIDQRGESNISIRSDIVSGDFEGTFNIFSLPAAMRKHFNQYFSLQDSTISTRYEPQKFSFDLTIKNTDLLTEVLIPELEPFVPGKIKGDFDSEQNKLDLEISLSTIRYNTIGMDSLAFNVTSNQQALTYVLKLKKIRVDTLKIHELQLGGEIANDSIRARLTVLDSLDKKSYLLGGIIMSEKDNFKFHFMPNEAMLNYKNWMVIADNYLQFSAQGLHAHNFSLSNNNEKIALVTSSKDSIVSFEFNELQLGNITKIVAGVVPASGKLNGNVKFTTSGNGEFRSTLRINDLTVLEQPWGNAHLDLVHTQAQNKYDINLLVKDENSSLKISGVLEPKEATTEFNLTADFAPFNLQRIEPFSGGQLKNVKGVAEGNLKLTGNTAKPALRGKLNFKEASFYVTYLNGTYSLQNEMIEFKESGISFNNFNIKDEKNNAAIIKGNIFTEAYKDFDLNLRITTKNFRVLHTTEDDNELYYGNVSINATARIGGNFTQPRVSLNLKLTNGSSLTYVVPQAEKMVVEQKGIVKFVDKDAIKDPFLSGIHIEDTVQSVFKGIDLTANLELTEKETLNIVIDPVTGDKLSVQGNATLTLDIDASGNMNLAGRYEITKGTYDFSFYKLVKRKFDITKGSTITWAGNPLNAELDIRASNTVETSPLDLVANQITSTNQQEVNSYKQRLPFLVYLNIDGQLLTPEISFELDMPVDKRNAFGGAIYSKIQDINSRESDLNKQVFALLILKRFISDNPLESQGGSELSNTARMSVSRLLSEQLNRLSENVKGVQLSVDLKSYEDYSTGEAQGQTKVQLGVSKSLFNDRLVVKLSGNLDIEGETSSQQDASDYIGDLALEYKLTSDGRFRVTGFRNSNYDMINGELTETGAGLIYIKDYNTLRELFKANEVEK